MTAERGLEFTIGKNDISWADQDSPQKDRLLLKDLQNVFYVPKGYNNRWEFSEAYGDVLINHCRAKLESRVLNVFQPQWRRKSTKSPPLSLLLASIQCLSPDRCAELCPAVTDSKDANASKSKGDVVVRHLMKASGEEAVGVVGAIVFDASETSKKEPLPRARISI